MLLEHGAAVSKFRGGAEAEDALAKKDFKRFVAIQREQRRKEKQVCGRDEKGECEIKEE